jgi:hypothetical protein
MNKYCKIILITVIFLLSTNVKAQDKILFLNGKMIEGSILEKTNYEFTFRDKKKDQFSIEKYRVFSYTQNNKESIVYEFDTLTGNFLNVNDMKMFVYGERDAHQTYKPNVSNFLGFTLGATAGYFMHKENVFIYIATPFIYVPITLLFPTKVKAKNLTEVKYLKEEEYLRGFERVARSKRTQGALKSTFAGVITGYLISAIITSIKN